VSIKRHVKLWHCRSFIVGRIHSILDKSKDLATHSGKSEAEISKWMRGTHNFTIDTPVSIEAPLGAPILQVYHVGIFIAV
jgi:hypothetical protein